MKSEFEKVGEQLAEFRAGRRGQAVRYPQPLRETAVRLAAERLETGEAFCAVARRLGLAPGTLERWIAAGPEQRFRPVEVVERPAAGNPTITLVTPSGFRFEGLDAAQAAELLARLDARQ